MTANFSSKRNSCPIIKLQACGPTPANQLRRASPPGPGLIGGYFTVEVKATAPVSGKAGVGKTFTQVPRGLLAKTHSLWLGSAPALFHPPVRPRTHFRKWSLGCVFGILFYGVKPLSLNFFFCYQHSFTSPPSSPWLETKVDLSWI